MRPFNSCYVGGRCYTSCRRIIITGRWQHSPSQRQAAEEMDIDSGVCWSHATHCFLYSLMWRKSRKNSQNVDRRQSGKETSKAFRDTEDIQLSGLIGG